MSIPAGLRLRDTSTAASPVESALSSRAGDLLASTSLLEKDDCLQGGRFIVNIVEDTPALEKQHGLIPSSNEQ